MSVTIEKICCRAAFDAQIAENKLPLTLDNAMWGSEHIRINAALAHDDENLYVAMRCYETEPRATVTEHEGDVHFDSCMEFFFAPTPKVNMGYFNAEINPNGAIKFNYGEGRHGRIKTHKLPQFADCKATVTPEYWQLVYTIPYALIREYAPAFEGKSGDVMRGNMYRCGEKAKVTSFMTLFYVDMPTPDYHQSSTFGEFIFG